MAAQPTAQKLPAPTQQAKVRNAGELRAYQALDQVWRRLAIHLIHEDQGATRVLGLTSATRGEGRTASSAGLAAALAEESGEPVVLLEADLLHPSLALRCHLPEAPGVCEYLAGRTRLEQALRQMPAANLLVAVAGHAQSAAQGRSVDVFSTALRKRFPQMLADLRKRFGYVIVDLPPLLENPGVEAMTGDLDAAVLVVRDGVTEASSAKQAAQLLEQANLIGVVRLAEASQMPGWLDNALGA